MLIGQLAAATNVSTKALRFYERQGLLPAPDRLPNGYRDYHPTAIARVEFIKQAQGAGFTLAQIHGILAIRDSGQAPCAHVDALIRDRLEHIAQRMAELTATRDALRHLARRSGRLDPSDCDGYCHIIEGLA
ncbi:MAG: heavy metal-responsive transcriptional regulator [Actinobacteria bacterium]|nr:heavy metal-responsive transcriptional regulator [Actinomycetota bacterium]